MEIMNKIKSVFTSVKTHEDLIKLGEEELKLASAALLVNATLIDGDFDDRELVVLKEILKNHYKLKSKELNQLINEAKKKESDAVDLYGFTSVLKNKLDYDGRHQIIQMLWEIIMADDQIHEFEANLVWRVAELLGVSSRDRIRIRKLVEKKKLDKIWDN